MKYYFLLPLLLASSVMAQEPDTSSALFSLREAECNFARESVMTGRNAAFVKYFAEESVLFTDKWITNGQQYSRKRKVSPFVLKWEPEFMDISASRDFGISAGPWEVQEYRPNTAPLATGYYLTVWKKQSDGEWKVILDGGSETPAVKNPQHRISFPNGADKPVKDPPILNVDFLSKELFDRDKQILALWEKSPLPSTYTSFFGSNARLQMNGHLPTTNADTINSLITRMDKALIWETTGSGVASSGDLGYTYGLLRIKGTSSGTKGHYVRIWKKLPGDIWKIELEMTNLE
jgi:ketosteroid isomerase-like protein